MRAESPSLSPSDQHPDREPRWVSVDAVAEIEGISWVWSCHLCCAPGGTSVSPGACALAALAHLNGHPVPCVIVEVPAPVPESPPPPPEPAPPMPRDPPAWAATLSKSESLTLRLLASGFTPERIATERVVSVHTVRSQVSAVIRKLGADSALHAVVIAWSSGWMP